MMRRRSVWAIAAGLLFAASLAGPGCAAPTLPLPPPEVDALTAPDAMGMVTVTGRAHFGAMVMVFNQDLNQGVITIADPITGAFQARLTAQSGHTISVWQRVGTDTSANIDQTVP